MTPREISTQLFDAWMDHPDHQGMADPAKIRALADRVKIPPSETYSGGLMYVPVSRLQRGIANKLCLGHIVYDGWPASMADSYDLVHMPGYKHLDSYYKTELAKAKHEARMAGVECEFPRKADLAKEFNVVNAYVTMWMCGHGSMTLVQADTLAKRIGLKGVALRKGGRK